MFYAGVGDGRGSGVGASDGGCKKEAEGNDAERGADVFIGDGPADGGFVDVHFAGDLGHGEWVDP